MNIAMTATYDQSNQAWVMVEDDDDFRGVLVMVDQASGEAVSLSCRNRTDVDQWEVMPSLDIKYPALRFLDLDKCRYLSQLGESICQLSDLQCLWLTRCERLTNLPDSIGQLQNLQEVGYYVSFLTSPSALYETFVTYLLSVACCGMKA
jgi:hypothetical protein